MAEHKVQVTLGGRYEGRQAFDLLHGDIKGMQNQMREVSEVSKHALGQIAGSFSGELAGSIRSTVGLLEEIGKGGIWGLMAAGVNLAITATVGWYTEMKKAAEEHRKLMEAMKSGQQALIADQIAAMAAREQASLDMIALSAQNAVKQIEALSAAYKGLAVAEDTGISAAGDLAIAKINSQFADRLNEACAELKPLVEAEKNLAVALQQQQTSRDAQKRAIERETGALQDLDAKIAAQKEVIAAEIAAGRDGAAARDALAKMEIERAAAELRLKNATVKAETTLLQHEVAVKNAKAAVDNATAAWDRAVAANDEANAAVEEKAALGRIHDEITRICMKNQVEEAAYIKLYTESIAKGLTHTEAYAKLQEKLNGELEKRADAEAKAAKDAEGSGVGGKDGKGSKGKPLYVSLSTSISDEIGRTGGKTWSETQKTARKQHNEMLKDALPLYRAMKGQMPKEQQKLFENYLMSKYTPDQVKKIWDEAQSKQLIDKSERKRQTKYLEAMVKAMEKQGLK